jgi:hypothetical protein
MKLKTFKERLIAVGLAIFALALLWNIIGIFTPSDTVKELNKNTEELRESRED